MSWLERCCRILPDVVDERYRQEDKWGDQSGNHDFEWASILGEEFGEVCAAANEANFKTGKTPGDFGHLRAELIQVAAVAVAWVEAIDKREGEIA